MCSNDQFIFWNFFPQLKMFDVINSITEKDNRKQNDIFKFNVTIINKFKKKIQTIFLIINYQI